MANPILDALGYVGDALAAPGDYARGVLAGRAGDRVRGSELLGAMGLDPGDGLGGTLAGLGVEMATDPLPWAGAGLGAALGRKAGAAAMARGPRYETTADDLRAMVGGVDDAPAGLYPPTPVVSPTGNPLAVADGARLPQHHVKSILANPNAAGVLSEIPPGSALLGAGAEGLALRTPTGGVIRVGEVAAGTPGRPVSAGVLQPTRAVDVPGSGAIDGIEFGTRVERLPLASAVGDRGVLSARSRQTMTTPMDDLARSLNDEGIEFWDRHTGNAGLFGGRPVVIDPGAVNTDAFRGTFGRVGTQSPAGPLLSQLIDLAGGDAAVRRAIDAGRLDPGMARSLATTGGGLGALAGTSSRL